MTYQRNNFSPLQDGFDEGLPDGVEQAQVATGEDREPERDGRALADLAPVGPLDALELVDAVPEEGDEPPAALARAGVSGALGGAGAAGRDEIALDLVVR